MRHPPAEEFMRHPRLGAVCALLDAVDPLDARRVNAERTRAGQRVLSCGAPVTGPQPGMHRAKVGGVRVAVFSDVHGNAVALQAVVDAALAADVDAFWVVGDLVANGPQPVETLRLLRSLPNLRVVRGNTDRYVVTGDLRGMIPPIDQGRTPSEVQALVAASSAHAWTRGCISTVGAYEWLADLPLELRCGLPDRTRVLLVHASPGRDDGPGLTAEVAESEVARQGWTACAADLVFVGHTHVRVDRSIDGVRVINVGSVSLPVEQRGATWTMIEADESGYAIDHRGADYDVAAVRTALESAHHPSAEWLEHKLGLDTSTD